MTKVQRIMLLSLLILTLILYALWKNKHNKKPIVIQPIRIAPLIIEKEDSPETPKYTGASDILLKLKIAAKQSQEKLELSKEERTNKILNTLKKQTNQQEEEKIIVVEKIKPIIKKPIVKVEKKPKITKVISKKIKETIKKPIAKIEKKVIKPKVQTVHQVVKKPKQVSSKKEKVHPIQVTPKPMQRRNREEEVALYKSQYANKLEVVGTSESFIIEESENSLPDSYYFKTVGAPISENTENIPLEYVEKLGVVEISNAYEVNFTIPD